LAFQKIPLFKKEGIGEIFKSTPTPPLQKEGKIIFKTFLNYNYTALK